MIENLVSETIQLAGGTENIEEPLRKSSFENKSEIPLIIAGVSTNSDLKPVECSKISIIDGLDKKEVEAFQEFASIEQNSIDSSDVDSDKMGGSCENLSSPKEVRKFKFQSKELEDLAKSFKERQPAKHVEEEKNEKIN